MLKVVKSLMRSLAKFERDDIQWQSVTRTARKTASMKKIATFLMGLHAGIFIQPADTRRCSNAVVEIGAVAC
jgi:hypothetical protein